MIKYLLILSFCFYFVFSSPQCQQFDELSDEELWIAIQPSTFQIYFNIAFGGLSIILLFITLLTWKLYPSFSIPSDIMFAICLSQLFENSSLFATSLYFILNGNKNVPSDFSVSCTTISIIFTIGNTSSLLYNLVFCIVLSLSIKRTLKGTLFNKLKYHMLVLGGMASITLSLVLTQMIGVGLSGICGYKLQDRQSFGRFSAELLVVFICLFCMYSYKTTIPKNSYFQKSSSFGYYYYYMGIFSIVQIISTLGYLIGNIACRSGSTATNTIISISVTIGSCESVFLSFFLVALRFSHPLVKQKIRKIFKKGNRKTLSDQEESQQFWLGGLIQSIRGSQIISLMAGIVIGFAEHQYKIKKKESLGKYSFKKNYIVVINQGVIDEYIERRIRNAQNFHMKSKLQGLQALDYKITAYSIDVFSDFLAGFKDSNIFKSFDINQNLDLIKQKAYSDGGKSGQFLFGTYDNKFIMKTVTRDQAELFIQKLEQFYEYFANNPNSLIAKILGIYKFERTDIKQTPTFLILMRNVSPYDRKLQERVYDIKGSIFNRSTIDQIEVDDITNLRTHTLKDVDFRKLEKKIEVQAEKGAKIKQQLKKDFQFLGRMQVIDYSLLIIKRKGGSEDKNLRQFNFHDFKSATEENQYYSIGIIDYLQSWTIRRKAQRAFKKLITKKQVTMASPERYSNRLVQLIDEIM